MSVWAVLPVKGVHGGKQRLSEHFDASQRESLCRALLNDALSALQGSDCLEGVVIVTRDAGVMEMARYADVPVLEETGDGLNAAVAQGASWVRDQGADTVLVMHADLPLVSSMVIDELIRCHQLIDGPHATLVPDRHEQGTNALVLSPPDTMPFAFGEGSLEKHLALAAKQGLRCAVLPNTELGCDLDTPEDIQALMLLAHHCAGQAVEFLDAHRIV